MIDIKTNSKFTGYKNFRDITNMSVTDLAAGSLNTFIHDGEKVEPRAGMDYLGVPGTQGVPTLTSIIIFFTVTSGTFTSGETINGATSAAVGTIRVANNTGSTNFNQLLVTNQTGTFVEGETITGAGSGATGVITQIVKSDTYWTLPNRIHSAYHNFINKEGINVPLRVFYSGDITKGDIIEVWLDDPLNPGTKKWYKINLDEPLNPLISTHRYYWSPWWDSVNLQSRVNFAFGAQGYNPSYNTNWIASWTGGIAKVTAVTATTITTDKPWVAKGFLDVLGFEGTSGIRVNGIGYTVTGDFLTDTITVASTTGISVGDYVFQAINIDQMPGETTSNFTVADVIDTINNQVYYIDWKQRNVYISHNRNITPSNGTLLTYGSLSGTFAYGEKVTGGTSGATGTIVIKFSGQLLFNVIVGDFVVGETITGTTSGATATVTVIEEPTISNSIRTLFAGLGIDDAFFSVYRTFAGDDNSTYKVIIDGVDTLLFYGLGLNDIAFSGSSTNTVRTTYKVIIDSSGSPDTFSWYKNDVLIAAGVSITGAAQALNNGISITFAVTTGHTPDDTWEYIVDPNAGTQDTYSVYLNGVLLGVPHTPITTVGVSLGNNIYLRFENLKGHIINDFWEAFAEALVFRGYQDFTYTNPGRLPGEGFTISLDSNGWTMKPQENVMLINAQAGHYYNVQLKLSADLKNESVVIERLKSEPQNKTLFPYLIGYIKNQLASVSQDKTYDVLGRQKFLQLQQTKSISDEVRIDFETSDWEDADILYFKRKIYFNLPRMSLLFVYDDYKKYWHAPMQFGKRISLLAIIDDKLVGHSYEQNESYELFVGLNDLGIFPIKTRMVFPYESFGRRMTEKSMDAVGFEGYMLGIPVINYTINAGLGGCEGQYKGTIAPQNTPQGICMPADRASLGKSSLGFHGLGNDPTDVTPHFYYIKVFDDMLFYMRNIELECDSLDQRWSLTSLGTQNQLSNINNESIIDSNPK